MMKPLLKSQPVVRLVEMAEVGADSVVRDPVPPLQLYRVSGSEAAADHKIFVVAGFQGPTKNDVHILGLLQRAFTRALFVPTADVYLVPVANPSSDPKATRKNRFGQDFSQSGGSEIEEVTILKRWISSLNPKALVFITIGTQGVTTGDAVPASVSQKLGEILEIRVNDTAPACDFACPELKVWAEDQGIRAIQFVIDETKKTFDEVRESDWRKHIGPALKWLVEGDRLNPPKEEPLNLEHLVVPALEMPPEFAHL